MSTYLALCTVAAACLGVGAVQAFHVNRAQAAAGAVQDDADAGLSQAFAHSVALSQTEAGTVPCTPCGVQTASVNCCMERAVESREKNYIEELKNYTDEEREARIEATARLFNTSEEMLRFKDVQFAYDKSNAVRNATYRSKMKAEADAQAQLASIAAQAAQQARLQTAEFYADKEARRAAKDIAGVVRVEEVQKAQKGIEDTSVDIVQGVRKDTIDLVSKIKQADEAAKLAAATKEFVEELEENTTRQTVQKKVANSTAEAAAQAATDLEKIAQDSALKAVLAESQAEADRKALEEAIAAYETLAAKADEKKEQAIQVNGMVAGQMGAIAQSALEQYGEVDRQGIRTVQEAVNRAVEQAWTESDAMNAASSSFLSTSPMTARDLTSILPPRSNLASMPAGAPSSFFSMQR